MSLPAECFCRHQSQKSLTQIPALDKRPERSQFSLEFVAANQLAVAENLLRAKPNRVVGKWKAGPEPTWTMTAFIGT
jgi:hypothetical protein